MRVTTLAKWGALGSLALLALWFRPDLPPAYGQGVGIYSRSSCSEVNLSAPVVGGTWCFDQTTNQLYAWTAGGFQPMTPSPLVASAVYFNMTDTVNNTLAYTATGTQQQIGQLITITGSNTASATNFLRIGQAIFGNTGGGSGGANSDGIEGLNITVAQNAADKTTTIVGAEISLDNFKASDTQSPAFQHIGASIDVYGGFATGPAALRINSGDTPGVSTWHRGIWIPSSTITNGGYAFDYEGQGFGPVRITASGSILNGNVTDKGAGTINIASAAFMNGFPVMSASGSGVNLFSIRSLSASSNISNNLRGTCTFAGAVTCAVSFPNNERDSNYFILVGGIVTVSGKSVSGFTMTATGTNSNAVDWMLVR